MGGTVKGGKLAAAANKQKYGDDFYKRIGAIGGRNGTTGGFAANRELARTAGSIGGSISRRGSAKQRRRTVKRHTQPTEPTCTFCHDTGHLALICTKRLNAIKYRRNLQDESRRSTSNLLAKYGHARPW